MVNATATVQVTTVVRPMSIETTISIRTMRMAQCACCRATPLVRWRSNRKTLKLWKRLLTMKYV